jgi:asparagine synthase (glutamine-hydrolysing)
MCGIAGFSGQGGRGDLAAMMAAIAHRGPDGSGTMVSPDGAVHLGHQRLAIIDPAGGAQPMWDHAGKICITYNGEVYNHRELRIELEQAGHVFLTRNSDTEVLLKGYLQWGTRLPERLNGMFAFCIYDATRRQLFLARDRFGEKPLFIAMQDDLFLFASELGAIARHARFRSNVNRTSLQKFFSYGYVPGPNALLQDTEKLPGGSAMVFDVEARTARRWTYWDFSLETDETWNSRNEHDLAEELRGLIMQAVRRRTMSDVPLGYFLSGGVDSSGVVMAARALAPADELKTFTLGFADASFDESVYAQQVAALAGSDHAVSWLDQAQAQALAAQVLPQLDEPSSDSSIIPTFALSRFARKSVKVVMTGDGGDELFAGYDPFAALGPARIYNMSVPRIIHQLVRGTLKHLPVSHRNMSLDFKVKRTLAGLSYHPSMWNPVWLGPIEPGLINDLFRDDVTPEELHSEAIDAWEKSKSRTFFDRSLEFYTRFYLQDGILAKSDRASMLNSLEARTVFLDNDIVDFCRKLPARFKMRGRTRKYLLKLALKDMLPDSILHRRKKGFGMPVSGMLATMPAVMPHPGAFGMTPNIIGTAWADHKAGRADNRLFLWSWLSLNSLAYSQSCA